LVHDLANFVLQVGSCHFISSSPPPLLLHLESGFWNRAATSLTPGGAPAVCAARIQQLLRYQDSLRPPAERQFVSLVSRIETPWRPPDSLAAVCKRPRCNHLGRFGNRGSWIGTRFAPCPRDRSHVSTLTHWCMEGQRHDYPPQLAPAPPRRSHARRGAHRRRPDSPHLVSAGAGSPAIRGPSPARHPRPPRRPLRSVRRSGPACLRHHVKQWSHLQSVRAAAKSCWRGTELPVTIGTRGNTQQ
jgi:hypothetical protein